MASAGMWRSPHRLYVNKDRTRIVPEDSPEAAFVLVGAGSEMPVAEAERLGLIEVREGQVRELALPEGGTPSQPVVVPSRVAAAEAAPTEEAPAAPEPPPTITRSEPEERTVPMPKDKPSDKDKS